VLEGPLTGLVYESDAITLVETAKSNLDALASLLVQYPEARIELESHTDNSGSEAEQSRRTRGRLRSIGEYLVSKGVRSDQLVLRSLAGTRPAFNNATQQGRQANNRVEVFEKPRL